jgi:hypothetical protein
MDVSIGKFVAGFGDLYRVSDIWAGMGLDDPEVMLENVSGDAWAFQWIKYDDLERHFEEVDCV